MANPTLYLSHRDGGKSSEESMYRLLNKIAGSTNYGIIGSGDLLVSQTSPTPAMTVDIAAGDLVIPYQGYFYYSWVPSVYTLTIAANSSGNARKDAIVAYVDLTVVQSTTSNNPGALKFMDVQGTPAGSPVVPSDSNIQIAIGAGNPFHRIANVNVANGASSIVNANITDTRANFILAATAANVLTFTNKKYSKIVAINEYDNGNSGASPAIDWRNGDRQKITLNANATFTFSNAVEGQYLTLWMYENGTGGYSITLPSIKWESGSPPSFDTTALAVHCITIRYDGTNYYGSYGQSFA